MIEEWKTVTDWDLYEVSNFGRLRGKDRIIKTNGGGYLRKQRLLHPVNDKHGYKTIWLKQDGKSKNVKIHRLVAKEFIPNPENKPCVNHIDNNPSNNRVDNLEWCTMQENTDWMIKQGRFDRTPEWLEHLHKSQEPTYKAVVGTNLTTGEKIYFKSINNVRNAGFQPSCVCVCCKHKNGITQHNGYAWEYVTDKEIIERLLNERA